tara:strand:+ start:32 stop:694 length:663 start_codon:yes stop_codon:yes gene_type:complete
MGIANYPIELQLIILPSILFALTFHEYAHAKAAYMLGDYTSYYQNRMNLNPLNHLDMFGTFALYFLGIGWAKPVPVSLQNLREPKKDMMLIAMAGPASNIFLAVIGSIIWKGIYLNFLDTILPLALAYFIFINIVLAIFNLLPLNPLDGSRILPLIVNNPRTLHNIEVYGPRFLIGLIILSFIGFPILSTIIFTPAEKIFEILVGFSFFDIIQMYREIFV